MSGRRTAPVIAAVFALAAVTEAQCQAPTDDTAQLPPAAPAPLPPPGEAPTVATPPAPAIEAGDRVFDRAGVDVGGVQTLVESPAGPMVVVTIDGKLISLPQESLQLDGDRLVSNQTKAQMLAAADAPPT